MSAINLDESKKTPADAIIVKFSNPCAQTYFVKGFLSQVLLSRWCHDCHNGVINCEELQNRSVLILEMVVENIMNFMPLLDTLQSAESCLALTWIGRTYHILGEVCHLTGKLEEAIRWLKIAIELYTSAPSDIDLSPWNLELRIKLAQISIDLNLKEDTDQYLNDCNYFYDCCRAGNYENVISVDNCCNDDDYVDPIGHHIDELHVILLRTYHDYYKKIDNNLDISIYFGILVLKTQIEYNACYSTAEWIDFCLNLSEGCCNLSAAKQAHYLLLAASTMLTKKEDKLVGHVNDSTLHDEGYLKSKVDIGFIEFYYWLINYTHFCKGNGGQMINSSLLIEFESLKIDTESLDYDPEDLDDAKLYEFCVKIKELAHGIEMRKHPEEGCLKQLHFERVNAIMNDKSFKILLVALGLN